MNTTVPEIEDKVPSGLALLTDQGKWGNKYICLEVQCNKSQNKFLVKKCIRESAVKCISQEPCDDLFNGLF